MKFKKVLVLTIIGLLTFVALGCSSVTGPSNDPGTSSRNTDIGIDVDPIG